jgi:tetratricopeptide (TPR) repeat protein
LNGSCLFAAENPQALLQKAESLLQQEKHSEALPLFEKVISADLSFTAAYRGLVACYAALGDPQGAVIHMETLFLENPASAEVSYGLGCAHYGLKNYDDAKKYFENAIKLDPDLVEAWNNSGAIYHFVVRDYEKARTYYEKAIALSERTNNARVLEVAKKNLSNLPSPEQTLHPVKERLTLEAFVTKFLDAVERSDQKRMRELVVGQKDNCEPAVEWFLGRAMSAFAQGDTEGEETGVMLARLIEKESREVHEDLSLQKKIMLYEALSKEQKREIIRGEKLLEEGLQLAEKGLFDKARTSYSAARSAFEHGRDERRVGLAFLYEGDACRKMKKYSQAREAYANALTSFGKTGADEQKALTLSSLGITYYHLGEYSDALESLKGAARIYHELEDEESEQKVNKNIQLIHNRLTQKEIRHE